MPAKLRIKAFNEEASLVISRWRWVCADPHIERFLNDTIPIIPIEVGAQMQAVVNCYKAKGVPLVVLELEEAKSPPGTVH